MFTVAMSKRGLVRKITAEIEVMALMKLTTSAATTAGRISGRMTRRTVVRLPARSVADASSRVGTIWASAASPEQPAIVDRDAERGHVVPQGQRVIEAPFLEEAAGENHDVDQHGERRPGQGEACSDRDDRSR